MSLDNFSSDDNSKIISCSDKDPSNPEQTQHKCHYDVNSSHIKLHKKSKKTVKSHFSLTPNILLELGFKAAEIALYIAIKSFSGEDGICFACRKTLCKKAGIGRDAYFKSKETLSKIHPDLGKPLIKVTSRISDVGDPDTDSINIIDIWEENEIFFSKGTPENRGTPEIRSTPTPEIRSTPTPEIRSRVLLKSGHKEEPYKKTILEEDTHTKKNVDALGVCVSSSNSNDHSPAASIPAEMIKFGECVELSQAQYDEFCKDWGKDFTDDLIEDMNHDCSSSGRSVANYAALMKKWKKHRDENPRKGKKKNVTDNKITVSTEVSDRQKDHNRIYIQKYYLKFWKELREEKKVYLRDSVDRVIIEKDKIYNELFYDNPKFMDLWNHYVKKYEMTPCNYFGLMDIEIPARKVEKKDDNVTNIVKF